MTALNIKIFAKLLRNKERQFVKANFLQTDEIFKVVNSIIYFVYYFGRADSEL